MQTAAVPGIFTSKPVERPLTQSPPNLEAEVIGLFVELSRMLGQPRSYAEIYGLIFISNRPLPMDEIVARLGISKGSVSQGLRFLRKAGAVKMVCVAQDRRIHYEALAELRHLAVGFLRDQILPQLEAIRSRLDQIAELIRQLPASQRSHHSGESRCSKAGRGRAGGSCRLW